MSNDVRGGVAFRVFAGNTLAAIIQSVAINLAVGGVAQVVYDDGVEDEIIFAQTSCPKSAASGITAIPGNKTINRAGWVTGVFLWPVASAAVGTGGPIGSLYAQVVISRQPNPIAPTITEVIAQGYIGGAQSLVLGQAVDRDYRATFYFQGTVASDATVGTHVATATITAAVTGSFAIVAGNVTNTGAAAVSASAQVFDPTGSFLIYNLFASVAAGSRDFPFAPGSAVAGASPGPLIVSGGCQLVLTATTSTVSDTQTFSVALRLLGPLPTVVLADNVGTPVITTNVSAVF